MSFHSQVLAALKWTVIGRISTQFVSWAITIVVMRLLAPADYGLLAMATLFSSLLAVIAEIGMGSSIIQSKGITPRQIRQIYGIVLLSNAGIVLLLSLVIAPTAAWFFAEPKVAPVVQAISLQFVPAAFGVIPSALLDREMAYKGRAVVGFVSAMSGAVLTLLLAYAGFHTFALVWGNVAAAAFSAIGLNWLKPYREWPLFDFSGIGHMIRFGRDVAANRLVYYFYSQADSFIVGKLLGKVDLGLYSVSMNLASMPASRLAVTIDQVAFPALAKVGREGGDTGQYILKSLRGISLLAFPVLWGMSCVAPELIFVLLGDSWGDAGLALRLLSLIMPLRVLGPIFHASLQSVGKANVSFRNTCTTALAMCVAFVIGCKFGLLGIALAWAVVFPLVFIFNTARTAPYLGITIGAIGGAVYKPMLASCLMYAVVTALRASCPLSSTLALLVLLVMGGAATYLGASFALNREGLFEAWRMLRPPR